MAAEHKAAHVLHRNIKLLGNKGAITRRIQHPGLSDYAVFRKFKRIVGYVSHRIHRIAKDDNNRFRSNALDVLAYRFHNTCIGIHEIIPAHSRLAGNTCCNNDNIRICSIIVIGGSSDLAVELLDRTGLKHVQRLALCRILQLGDIEQHDVAELLLGKHKCRSSSGKSGAYNSNFITFDSHRGTS
ncbi:hypothetical protein D3C75_550920 [compost metagenome]